ncbi:hypothetical protein PR048_025264 [Dryococelus australis]|uniref:Uncharacterized protein n=1 Tax=Dryococelus australis TaxID=614101 RepID=A0ABQ9GQW3_9NEOP|nr:hypothetical protein PR048_025264 [Dryococelus australis]
MAKGSIFLSKEDLEELLRPILNAKGTKVEDVSVQFLTKPGDNYGSTMLAVDVNLTPGPRTLPQVAKMLPESSSMQQFQFGMSVRKEIDMCKLAGPAFESIQKEKNVPEDKYFRSCRRYLGHSAGELEDPRIEIGDRFIGLNLAHCKFVVDKMVRFHATAITLKIKKPEEFRETVLRAQQLLSP